MLAILFISALSGIASGIQLFSNGTSRTASEWLSCSGVDLAVSLALWTLLPAATAAAVAILGKAAEPSASPIRLAMDDFDARKRERLLAESERAGLEAEITTPTNRSPSAYGRRL
jgi:hypothetical protein